MEFYEYFYPYEFRLDASESASESSSSPSWDSWEVEPPANSYSLETFELCEDSEGLRFLLGEDSEGSGVVKMQQSPQPNCHVCDSPTANTLHFGGRSCKACAAFFRRSVSMSMTYECIGSAEEQCKIHFELRMLCRHCRFIKCLDAGMKKELVQAKKEEIKVSKRKSRGLVRCVDAKQETTYEEYLNAYGNGKSEPTLNTPKSEAESELVVRSVTPETLQQPQNGESSNSVVMDLTIPSVVSLSPPPSAPNVTTEESYVMAQPPPTDFKHLIPPFDPLVPSTSRPFVHRIPRKFNSPPLRLDSDDKTFALLELYVRSEASLNDRRRIMYTDTQIRDVFDTVCECPYERRHLKLFNYRTFCGFVKHDFVMILDYVHTFPEFAKLKRNEKNVFYRMACAVDSMMCSAYYTYRAGINEHFLVLFNGDYIPMLPMPMTGDEPNAASHFENDQDFTKYKTLMPLKLKQYYDMAVPFARLEVSFEEFVLLKALTIWHISNYKLDQGREICARQRDTLVQALHRVVEERGDEDPGIRVGQLLLSMSYIMEQVQAMTSSYLLMTFFDVVTCDSILQDMLTFRYNSASGIPNFD